MICEMPSAHVSFQCLTNLVILQEQVGLRRTKRALTNLVVISPQA